MVFVVDFSLSSIPPNDKFSIFLLCVVSDRIAVTLSVLSVHKSSKLRRHLLWTVN